MLKLCLGCGTRRVCICLQISDSIFLQQRANLKKAFHFILQWAYLCRYSTNHHDKTVPNIMINITRDKLAIIKSIFDINDIDLQFVLN